MKKIILLLSLLFLTGCGVTESLSTNQDIKSLDNVTLQLEDVTNKSLKYTIINNTGKTITTTNLFIIEHYKNNTWYQYDIDLKFNEDAIEIDKTYQEELGFKNHYGRLPKGTYRLIKIVNNYKISCEFNID